MEEQQKSWFGRNWPWLVPAGGCLTVIIIGIVFLGITFTKLPELISKSEPISVAIQATLANETANEALGKPIEVDQSRRPDGEMTLKNNEGRIDMVFPLKGSRADAMLYINAEKKDGVWIYNELYILVNDTQQRIELEKPLMEDF